MGETNHAPLAVETPATPALVGETDVGERTSGTDKPDIIKDKPAAVTEEVAKKSESW